MKKIYIEVFAVLTMVSCAAFLQFAIKIIFKVNLFDFKNFSTIEWVLQFIYYAVALGFGLIVGKNSIKK